MASITPATLAAQPTMQSLPQTALASPYDGTNPALGMPVTGPAGPYGGIAAGLPTGGVPQLTGLTGGRGPQVNATNQTAFAPNGNVNQVVTNSNQYTNKYYNIVVPTHGGGLFGGIGGASALGSWNTPGNSFVDPKTGVLYVQKDQGFGGWLKRLFRGY
ncbi:MAG: hypothetical protein JWM86_829 [Thermoleophilia bacterium]|nr:hypothetical protein [Thermoleophilia bacterium]